MESLQNPAFGPVQVRKFTEIFMDKANAVGSFVTHDTYILTLCASDARYMARPGLEDYAQGRPRPGECIHLDEQGTRMPSMYP